MSGNNWNEVMIKIKGELASLAQFIDKTRNGIDTLETTVKVGSERFPEASNQIAAVTGDLENAANNIMTILEDLMAEQDKMHASLADLTQWAGSLGEADGVKGLKMIGDMEKVHNKTKTELMEIFTNMSFHDLSGQKLKKVIGSLAVVESKLLEMALSFGFEDKLNTHAPGGFIPQAQPEKPIDQNVVDKLLKELGA
ncbi:MAG: protein phosphatase CheZ [Deltaproteobacteria bacterium]|nr:protein phosphatase CheZ [Deltaproteobacteria bacterium]